MRLFSTEQVTKYHPDKYADQISDAVLTACLQEDPESRVACECLVKGGTVVLAGEITTTAKVNYAEIATRVARKLGYTANNIITYIEQQSPEIAGGVKSGDDLCAGDQGIMFGYATKETESGLPYALDLANMLCRVLEFDAEQPNSALKGDAKVQVTVDLEKPRDDRSLVEILISVCHKEQYTLEEIRNYVENIVEYSGIDIGEARLNINPAGRWTIGGPAADCGLTGRKIVCDQYGGFCPVGGGAFSGKDPSKVDRSAAYMANYIARDLVKNNDIEYAEVQLAYAIGEAQPMSVHVETNRRDIDRTLAEIVAEQYDLSPAGIIKFLDLLNVDYEKLAEGCHYRMTLPKRTEA
ncbi:MAG: methionine adenosyltransferase [Clostridia bacterium]|nr:methionine adenosyltransferase [Clostridia bacterium]